MAIFIGCDQVLFGDCDHFPVKLGCTEIGMDLRKSMAALFRIQHRCNLPSRGLPYKHIFIKRLFFRYQDWQTIPSNPDAQHACLILGDH